MRTSQGSSLDVIIIDFPLATDGCKWVLASRSAQTDPNELTLGKIESTEGILEWLDKPSRCHRLLLAVSTPLVLLEEMFWF